MKVQCPSCKEIVEMTDFSTTVAGLSFSCPACQKTHFLSNPKQSPAGNGDLFSQATPAVPSLAATLAAEEIVCPKCGHAQKDSWACHRCGLVFSKFDPASLPPDPPQAAALWLEIEQRPDEAALHERFLQAARQAGRLDYAARQYRLLERRAGLGELARQYQQRLVQLAQASLPVEIASTSHDTRSGRRMFWLLVILAMLGGLIGWSLYYYGQLR